MIYLLLSILCSTLILDIFRIFERNSMNVFQGIVYNYITACAVGFLIFGDEWNNEHLPQGTWIPYVFIVGTLFISLFSMIGSNFLIQRSCLLVQSSRNYRSISGRISTYLSF